MHTFKNPWCAFAAVLRDRNLPGETLLKNLASLYPAPTPALVVRALGAATSQPEAIECNPEKYSEAVLLIVRTPSIGIPQKHLDYAAEDLAVADEQALPAQEAGDTETPAPPAASPPQANIRLLDEVSKTPDAPAPPAPEPTPKEAGQAVKAKRLRPAVQIQAEKPHADSGVLTSLAELPPKAMVDVKALAQLLGVKSTKTITRMVARGELPPPLPFGGRSRWVVESIHKHIEESAAKRAAEAATWRAAQAVPRPAKTMLPRPVSAG